MNKPSMGKKNRNKKSGSNRKLVGKMRITKQLCLLVWKMKTV